MTTVINHNDLLNFFYEVEDLKAQQHSALFGAIVIFDLSKRPLCHATQKVLTISIVGDDLQDALRKLRENKVSYGLKDCDFEPSVFKVALCFDLAK
ncbi:hypothetical protein [Photobacterium damselae]|uniref:hypothetical protein n=1 Tax=Photobacterium damselae TaxID=38293 RepID=UPI0040697927